MTQRIAFFDAKPYDQKSFNVMNQNFGFAISYFETKLNEQTTDLANGYDGVCAFVNDDLNGSVVSFRQDFLKNQHLYDFAVSKSLNAVLMGVMFCPLYLY